MKKSMFAALCLSSILALGTVTSCSDNESAPSYFIDPNEDTNIKDLEVLFGNNEGAQQWEVKQNVHITKGTYLMKGWCYITDGVTVTIDPGTVIRGDKSTKAALIVERGGKLIAEGTAQEPIVMTSMMKKGLRRPGDWGGLIICGKANNNQKEQQIEGGPRTKHGGNDDNDNSGIFKYIRVEFAGFPFEKDKEINGITFGSVGKGTVVDHLQVSYSNDDSFEWFGGSVDCKHLIAYKGWDDDFDTDNGFSGNVQFCLGVRDPKIADVSQSNGFESDNCADGNIAATPITTAVFSNVTFVGPATKLNADFQNTSDYINAGDLYPNNNSGLGKFQSAMQIRRSSNLNCVNSVAIGWPIGLIIDGEKGNTVESAKEGKIVLQNIYLALGKNSVVGTDANKKYEDVLGIYSDGKITYDETKPSYSSTFFKAQKGNTVFENEDDLKLIDTKNVGQKYAPTSESPLLGKASFDAVPNATQLEKVTYIGAFSAQDNWMDNWTNFDPENTDY